MTDAGDSILATRNTLVEIRRDIESGKFDRLPAAERRKILLPLFSAMIDVASAAHTMHALVGKALEKRG